MRAHLEAVVLTLISDENHFVWNRMPEQSDVEPVCPAVREFASSAI
jgi:hypothetical protein